MPKTTITITIKSTSFAFSVWCCSCTKATTHGHGSEQFKGEVTSAESILSLTIEMEVWGCNEHWICLHGNRLHIIHCTFRYTFLMKESTFDAQASTAANTMHLDLPLLRAMYPPKHLLFIHLFSSKCSWSCLCSGQCSPTADPSSVLSVQPCTDGKGRKKVHCLQVWRPNIREA